MVLVELDVGNIMPYVTREAPSTTSFCHDDSTVNYFLPAITINPRKGCRGWVLRAAAPLHKVTIYETGN